MTSTETTPKSRRRTTRGVAKPGRTRRAPDALDNLIEDHRRVDALLERATSDRVRRDTLANLVEQIGEELAIHAGIEEMVLYPAARAALQEARGDDDADVLEALEEHHVVKSILAELARLPVADERFAAKVSVLAEIVRHHVKEEETELFPRLRRLIPAEQLQQMGPLLDEARIVAPRQAHPHAPDQPPGNIIANVMTLPVDLVGKVVSRVVHRIAG